MSHFYYYIEIPFRYDYYTIVYILFFYWKTISFVYCYIIIG